MNEINEKPMGRRKDQAWPLESAKRLLPSLLSSWSFPFFHYIKHQQKGKDHQKPFSPANLLALGFY